MEFPKTALKDGFQHMKDKTVPQPKAAGAEPKVPPVTPPAHADPPAAVPPIATPPTADTKVDLKELFKDRNVKYGKEFNSIDDFENFFVDKYKDYDDLRGKTSSQEAELTQSKAEYEKLKKFQPANDYIAQLNVFAQKHADKPMELFQQISSMTDKSDPDAVIKLMMKWENPDYIGMDKALDLDFQTKYTTDDEEKQGAFAERKEMDKKKALAKFDELKASLVPDVPTEMKKPTAEEITTAKKMVSEGLNKFADSLVAEATKEPVKEIFKTKGTDGKETEFAYEYQKDDKVYSKIAKDTVKTWMDSEQPVNEGTGELLKVLIDYQYDKKMRAAHIHSIVEQKVADALHEKGVTDYNPLNRSVGKGGNEPSPAQKGSL